MVRLQAKAGEFATPYTCTAALTQGGAVTKLSALVMGLGNIVHGQVVKGLLFLLAEIAYVVFMIRSGFHNLAMLVTLGTAQESTKQNRQKPLALVSLRLMAMARIIPAK